MRLLGALFGLAVSTVFNVPFAKFQPFTHTWERSVGSDHAAMLLRADYREQLTQISNDLHFQRIRFHGLLDDDMSAYLNGEGNYINIFSIFDFLLSINMRPLVEIGFMPGELASGPNTTFAYRGNISPPKSWELWSNFISDFVSHLVERYGRAEISTWYFEIWNEPNCGMYYEAGCCLGTCGSLTEYLKLYTATSTAIKAVDPAFKVGGPSTAQLGWLPDFCDFAVSNLQLVDFVSSHLYPNESPPVVPSRSGYEELLINTSQYVNSRAKRPLIITEMSTGCCALTDEPYAAAFVVHDALFMNSHPEIITSYWAVSDLFEEGGLNSDPFQEGFGLMTVNGIKKPVYRAYQMLANLEYVLVDGIMTDNNVDLVVTSSSNISDVTDETQEISIQALLTNFNRIGLPIDNTTSVDIFFNLTLILAQLRGKGFEARVLPVAVISYIDSTHAAPRRVWEDNGSPRYPSHELLHRLEQASIAVQSDVNFTSVTGSVYQVRQMMERYSVLSVNVRIIREKPASVST